MDFAAQLAKLERQAVNAAKKTSTPTASTSSSTTTPNNNNGSTTTFEVSGGGGGGATTYRGDRPTIQNYNRSTNGVELDPRRRQRDRSPYQSHHPEYSTAPGGGEHRSIRRRYDHPNNNSNNHHHHSQYQRHPPHSRRSSPSNSKSCPFPELQQSGYRIRPSLPWVPKSDRTKPHICLLAIIIDELPYEHIWRAWADQNGTNNDDDDDDDDPKCYVSLVCHAKYPKRVQSPWVRQRLLVQPPQIGRGGNARGRYTTFADPIYHTHVPEWGSIEIARAMIDCLKDGVLIGTKKASDMTDVRYTPNRYVITQPPRRSPPKEASTTMSTSGHDDSTSHTGTIPTVDKFIFISESCLPVMTLDEYVKFLFPMPEAAKTAPATLLPDNPSVSVEKNDDETNDKDARILSPNTDVESSSPNEVNSTVSTPARDMSTTTTVLPTDTKDEREETVQPTPVVDPWDVSWVNGRSRYTVGTPRNMYENNQFQFIDARIPDTCRYKADQWILLSRRHAIQVLHIDEHISQPQYQFWTLFQKINASDEMYFPTVLGILGLLKEDGNDPNNTNTDADTNNNTMISPPPLTGSVVKRSVTYTDWSQGMRNPTSFTNGVRDLETVARLARQQQCLLARKFIVVPSSPPPSAHSTSNNPSPPDRDPPVQHILTGQITADEWWRVVANYSSEELP
jgi:hypothetical protein